MKKGSFSIQMMVNGVPAREFSFDGRDFFLVKGGTEFILVCRNVSDASVEVSAFVDGLRTTSGRGYTGSDLPVEGNRRVCGHLVPSRGSVEILGYMLWGTPWKNPFRLGGMPRPVDDKVADDPPDVGGIVVRFFSIRTVATVPPLPTSPSRRARREPPSLYQVERDELLTEFIIRYDSEAGFVAAGIVVLPEAVG